MDTRPTPSTISRYWRTIGLVLVIALVASACGTIRNISETVSGVRDAVTDVRDLLEGQDGVSATEPQEPLEWEDLRESGRFCGATWTRDEAMAAYDEHGLSGLPRPVGFTPNFSSEIDEFFQRWLRARVVEEAQARRQEAGGEPMRLISCIVGTRGRDDPRDSVGVNVLFINDHSVTIERPTLTGLELELLIAGQQGESPSGDPDDFDAALRWAGECPRNVTMLPGTYTQTRCNLDGPGGLTSQHQDAPQGFDDDGNPSAELSGRGLTFTPDRETFVEILADPDISYSFRSRATVGWREP